MTWWVEDDRRLPGELCRWGPGRAGLGTCWPHPPQMWRRPHGRSPPSPAHPYQDLTTTSRTADLTHSNEKEEWKKEKHKASLTGGFREKPELKEKYFYQEEQGCVFFLLFEHKPDFSGSNADKLKMFRIYSDSGCTCIWDVCWPHDPADLLHGLQIRRKP